MRFACLVPLFFAAAAQAIDFREPYRIPAEDTMVEFTNAFDNACATWPAAISEGLTFSRSFVHAGNFNGSDPDTIALIFCTWAKNGVSTAFTDDVAASLGATHLL
ncbi:unnamed protein product [Mycena citricolor]|uniref:Uncharacterized protein n=1 Tax=Mycena citricolor TaxID=2018698 RepID=A0AAD2H1Y6_9AGAR|nr:unnamed protein product [Mycena citricolor]